MQRLRVRYAKRDRLRFMSHRDVARALERAIRRADIPVAFSAGFSPHPRISYIGAAPTGAASEAEYFELGLSESREPSRVRIDLDAALPPGLDVLEVVEAVEGKLADRVDASCWSIRTDGIASSVAVAAVVAFLEAGEVPVQRKTKDGMRTLDARAAVAALGVEEGEGCVILNLVVRHLTPAVRPDDVLTALRAVAGLEFAVAPVATRLAQGRLDAAGTLHDPLA